MKKTPRTMILTLLALATLILAACESSTIGNGQVDPIEEAALRMAVGVAISHHPEAALPAYRVADGLLLVLDPARQATAGELDTAIAAELQRLDLDPASLASFMELSYLVRVQVIATLKQEQIAPDKRVIILCQLVEVVRQAASARLREGGHD